MTVEDKENLFVNNQNIRWLLFDEGSMIGDNLGGRFEAAMRNAAVTSSPFYKRARRSSRPGNVRAFGGYNFLMFVDWWQLPPVPASRASPSAKVGNISPDANIQKDQKPMGHIYSICTP